MAKEKLTNCKTCGAEIAKNAKVCPSCGAKNKSKNFLWVGIIIACVVVAIIASGGGEDGPEKIGDVTVDATGNVQNSKNDATEFGVGEIAKLKDVTATMINVSESTGSAFNNPQDGNVFVLCEFEIANNSDEEMTISSMLSFEAYCDDYACSYSLGAVLEKGNKNQLDGTIAPGKKMNGVIGYEVPADWSKIEIHFTPDVWSEKDIVFVVNK